MTTLRQRLRKSKINCHPWKRYKRQIRHLPISAQTLFSNKGIPIDIIEIELKEDGWLFKEEDLFEVLSRPVFGLYRKHLSEYQSEWQEEDIFDPGNSDWTEEDYKQFYLNQDKLY